jgi:C1A family cysteine protease
MFYQSAVVLAVLAVASANLHDRAYYEEKFFNWLKEHDISAVSGGHFVQMLQNYADNDDHIETHNAGNATFTLGHNRFSHMSLSEWQAFVHQGGLQRPEASTQPEFIHQAPADTSNLADSIDWRTKGAVASVKDQGQCGSCWSFSATGALEGAYYLKAGKLVDFSPQHFVDCDNRQNSKNKGTDMGCNGGLMDSAFSWASKNGGLCEWNDYKYTSGTTKKSGTCQDTTCGKKADHSPKSYTDVQKNSDTAMVSALNKQPVAVAIEADTKEFQLYKSGIFTAKCGSNLDHGVLAVGYGHDSATNLDYYIVKNSWGTSWGDKGYIYFQKGGNMPKEGQCGILSGPPSYPNF